MLQKIETAIEGIGTAIEKGMMKRSSGEQEAAARKLAIVETVGKLDAIKENLSRIKTTVDGTSEG
jgi:hypothetical protein